MGDLLTSCRVRLEFPTSEAIEWLHRQKTASETFHLSHFDHTAITCYLLSEESRKELLDQHQQDRIRWRRQFLYDGESVSCWLRVQHEMFATVSTSSSKLQSSSTKATTTSFDHLILVEFMRHLKVQLKAGRSTRANWPCPSQETASAVTANNIFICPKDPTWFLLTIQLQPVHADPSIHPLFKTRLTVFQSPGSQGSESQAVGTLRSARFNCFPAEADSISTDQRSHESVILQRKTFQHSNSQLAIRPAVEVIATQSAINADQDCIYLTIALRNPLPCSLQVRSVSLEQSLQYSSTLLPHESAEFTMEPDAVQSLLLRIRFPKVAYHIGEVKGRSDGDSVPNLDLMGVHTTSRLIVCCLPADISSGPLTASVAAAVEMRFPLDIILQSHSHIAPSSLPTTTTAAAAAAADNCNNGLLISFKPVSQCVPVSRVFTVNASLNNRSNRRRILCISIPTYLPSSSSFNHKRQSIDTYLGEYYRQQSTMSHTAGDSVVKQSQFICLDNDTVVDLGPGEATVLSLHFIPIGGEGSLQSLDLVRLVDITDDNNCTAGSLSSQQVTQLRQVFQVFVIN